MTASRPFLVLCFAAVVTVALAGCSGSSAPAPGAHHASATEQAPAANDPPAAASTRHHVKTPFDALLKDEQKAKNVQQVINASAQRTQQAIEKQTH